MLCANKLGARAVLFGSWAKEALTCCSNLDIALFGEYLTTADQAHLANGMKDLAVPQRAELILFEGLKDAPLRECIRQDGPELYSRQENAPAVRLNVSEEHRRMLVSLYCRNTCQASRSGPTATASLCRIKTAAFSTRRYEGHGCRKFQASD